MIRSDLFPSLINWPLVLIGSLVGFFVGFSIGPIHTSWIIIPLLIGSEWYRVHRITASIPSDATVAEIRAFYSRDAALKYVPTKSQVDMLSEFIQRSREKKIAEPGATDNPDDAQ